jgi:N-acetylglucosamine repressor
MDSVLQKNKDNPGNKKTILLNQLFSLFYHDGCKSIPELSKSLNVSIPTVTRLLANLCKSGYVIDIGEGESSGGRKPALYGINPDSTYVVGIDISRFQVRIGLVNLRNQFVVPVSIIQEGLSTQSALLQKIKSETNNIINKSGISPKKILGAGIALPGLIDSKTGISYSYFSETGKPLSQVFGELFPFPVFVEHDTKAMAIAESIFGLAKGKQNVLCLIIGAGIGLGMILGGRLYKGNSGFAGEFGHIPVVENGQLCMCGKTGCLETLASGATLIQNAREGIKAGAASHIARLTDNNPEKISLEIILKAISMGDQYAISLLSQTGKYLGKGIAVLIHLFNPELIIIGGELSNAGNYLLDPVRETLNQHTIARILKDTSLVTSELGENATLMGTIALVINNYFDYSNN